MDNTPADDILYQTTLKPRRSAKPGAGFIVLLVLGFFWSVIGGGAAYFGVWPLSVFYGAEFILILGIVRMFVKTGNRIETITLKADTLHVKGPGRFHAEKSFDPYWARVVSDSADRRFGHIEISSHGERMIVGALLTANECDDIARQLNAALASLKEAAPKEL
jgi:uncharacterized membrane protein